MDVGYVGSKGTDLIVTLGDMNRPIATRGSANAGTGVLNARRPNQAFQRAVTADKSIGNSIYHSLQVKAERRMAAGLTFLTAYTWSKSISGPSDIGGQVGGGFYIGGIQDIYNLRAERAVSGFDIPHRFVQTVLYDLPFFKSSIRIHEAAARWLAGVDNRDRAIGIRSARSTSASIRPARASARARMSPARRRICRAISAPGHAGSIPMRSPDPVGRFGTSPRTNAIRLPGSVQLRFLGEQNICRERTLPAGAARRGLQPVQSLQPRSANSRSQHPFADLRKDRRWRERHHYASHPIGSKILFLK